MLSQNLPTKVVCLKVLGFSDMAAAGVAGTSAILSEMLYLLAPQVAVQLRV
jgi:hypothetical protein